MTSEKWKAVEGHEGLLEVSDFGRVQTLGTYRTGRGTKPGPQFRKGKVLSPFLAANGYPTVAPKFGENRRKMLVHRLVAKAFVPGHFPDATVNHKDGDKTNNVASNLEWISRAENTAHQWRTGLVDLRGENHPSAKLSRADVEAIRRRCAQGETQRSLSVEFGVSNQLISDIVNFKKRVV